METNTSIYRRSNGILPIEQLQSLRIAVVGCGSIGRQCAIQLATMGAMNLTLIDHDKVESHNAPVQGYPLLSVGLHKVQVLREQCEYSSPELNAFTKDIPSRFTRNMAYDVDVIFSTPDNMDCRLSIWNSAVINKSRLILDGRLLGECCVIAPCDLGYPPSVENYKRQLFPDSEAEPTDRCSIQTTLYGACLCASLLMVELAKWVRGEEVSCPYVLTPQSQSIISI